jgi:hypothetical protein
VPLPCKPARTPPRWRGLVCWMDIKSLCWIHSPRDCVMRYWRTGGLLVVATLGCHTALAGNGVGDQIERAQLIRGLQESSESLNNRSTVLPSASLEPRQAAEDTAGADRRWRELLGAQQRDRVVPGGMPAARSARALAGGRADRADALSRRIRQQDWGNRSSRRP